MRPTLVSSSLSGVSMVLWAAAAFPPPALAQSGIAIVDHAALRDRAISVLEAQFGAFQAAADTLAASSSSFCDGTLPREGYAASLRDTWLTWAPLDAYQFGPVEQRAAVLSVAFWPDKKDYVGRGLEALLALPPESLSDPETIVQGSAAAQGLPAIERLLHTDMEACPAVIGISRNLDAMAQTLFADWFAPSGWADLLRSAGPSNPVYRSDAEVTKALFSALTFELTVIADSRLGRPLGTFEMPRGTQAEAWRAGLSFDIIDAQLEGVAQMLEDGFAGALPGETRTEIAAALAEARARIAEMDAPLDEMVSDPMTRIRVEGLQTQVRYLSSLLLTEVGPALAVESGFSPADGD